jgi:hypothetical protein
VPPPQGKRSSTAGAADALAAGDDALAAGDDALGAGAGDAGSAVATGVSFSGAGALREHAARRTEVKSSAARDIGSS